MSSPTHLTRPNYVSDKIRHHIIILNHQGHVSHPPVLGLWPQVLGPCSSRMRWLGSYHVWQPQGLPPISSVRTSPYFPKLPLSSRVAHIPPFFPSTRPESASIVPRGLVFGRFLRSHSHATIHSVDIVIIIMSKEEEKKTREGEIY